MFEAIISEIQKEAIANQALLAELAGLESYIAETYAQRCLTELIQNSDDSGATIVDVRVRDNCLIYANNGRHFTIGDFQALCKSALSNKKRGESIGYRGIGFKSVVNICSSVMILSGELKCIFDRNKTHALLQTKEAVPLIRVPHILSASENVISTRLIDSNPDLTTYFVFRGLNKAALSQEFDSFSEEHVLFLRSINRLVLKEDKRESLFEITRNDKVSEGVSALELNRASIYWSTRQSSNEWIIAASNQVSIAVREIDSSPSRLAKDEALIHAYLPTQSLSGIGARVNADFSTDPSRTRLKYDSYTDNAIALVADLFVQIIKAFAQHPKSSLWRGLLDALIPYSQYKVLELQGNKFCTLLIQALAQQNLGQSVPIRAIPGIYKDIEHLAEYLPLKESVFVPISSSYSDARKFLELIGIPKLENEITLGFFADSANAINPRCAPLFIRNLLDTGFNPKDLSPLHIFPTSNSSSMNVEGILSSQAKLDPAFIADLIDKLMSVSRARRLLIEAGFPTTDINTLLPVERARKSHNEDIMPAGSVQEDNADSGRCLNPVVQPRYLNDEAKRRYGIRDWRIAEELVAFHYRSQGFQVLDVSKANKGYDLEVISPDNKLCVEVKKLSNPPNEFSLTQNEFNESIMLGPSFVVALVCSYDDGRIEIMLVPDPYRRLSVFTTKRIKSYEFLVSGFTFAPSAIYR
jgi:hypothetical protein